MQSIEKGDSRRAVEEDKNQSDLRRSADKERAKRRRLAAGKTGYLETGPGKGMVEELNVLEKDVLLCAGEAEAGSAFVVEKPDPGYLIYMLAMHEHVRMQIERATRNGKDRKRSVSSEEVIRQMERAWENMCEEKREEWRSQASILDFQEDSNKPAGYWGNSANFSVSLSNALKNLVHQLPPHSAPARFCKCVKTKYKSGWFLAFRKTDLPSTGATGPSSR